MDLSLKALQSDPALMVAAAVVGMGLLGLVAEMIVSSFRRVGVSRSPIVITGDAMPRAAGVAFAPRPELQPVEAPAPVAAAPVAPVEPPKDPLVEHRRFFATLGAALNIDETAPVALAALHANLTSDVFMQRMTLATRAWRPDGFAAGARELTLKADGTPPDIVATKVLEGYEQLKTGKVKEALEAFLAAIDAARSEADADASNPWPHAWSAFAWRGLAIIAEEAGDTQATLAGLKVAYQSMVNAFEITMQGLPA
jgi:hypothetical protein